jgi:hypothetical protein
MTQITAVQNIGNRIPSVQNSSISNTGAPGSLWAGLCMSVIRDAFIPDSHAAQQSLPSAQGLYLPPACQVTAVFLKPRIEGGSCRT